MLSEAEPPPFPVDDASDADESVRLRYRYIDLRRPRMQRNLRLRGRVTRGHARAMVRQGFCEIETPLLWTPTPEGAREFAVPSRLHKGEFYVLPQSPQIAKQLLMVGGSTATSSWPAACATRTCGPTASSSSPSSTSRRRS